jgi:hypothetical protein
MIPQRKPSDSIAEWAIVALVVVVLGVAATGTRFEPASPTLSIDELAARVRMQAPIARECVRVPDPGGAPCASQVAANGRP